MDSRNYLSGAVASPPAAPGAPSNGYPTEGTPGVQSPTVPGAYWFFKIGESLRNLIIRSGQTPNDGATDALQMVAQAVARLAGSTVTTFTHADSPVTLTAAHAGLVLLNAAGGNIVVNLPLAADVSGLPFELARTDTSANTVTYQRQGTNTIEGATSRSLGTYTRAALRCDGVSEWRVITSGSSQGGRLRNVTVISAAGANTYTKPEWLHSAEVWVVGSGGGGGGALGGSGEAEGGGGGGGEVAFGRFSASAIGATETVTIGAKGTGGAAGNNNGTAGGTTSFGALLTAAGGAGGTGSANTSANGVSAGGAGGTGGAGGSFRVPGRFGNHGRVISGALWWRCRRWCVVGQQGRRRWRRRLLHHHGVRAMKRALILANDVVGDIVSIGEEFEVAPPCRWVDAPDEVTRAWVVSVGDTLAPPAPPVPSLAEVERYVAEVSQAYTDEVAAARRYGRTGLNPTLYCLSFYNSTDPLRRADAQEFNAFRDAVLQYGYEQAAACAAHPPLRDIPTRDEYASELRANVLMIWPTA